MLFIEGWAVCLIQNLRSMLYKENNLADKKMIMGCIYIRHSRLLL